MLAYALSRPGSFGSRAALLVVLFSLLFSPGLIPAYLTVRGFGLIDTFAALILPGRGAGERADRRSGEWQTFTRIVTPLSKAVLAVVGRTNCWRNSRFRAGSVSAPSSYCGQRAWKWCTGPWPEPTSSWSAAAIAPVR